MTVQVASAKKTNIRYLILLMIFIVTTINYADRSTLSMAATSMSKDLGINQVSMGYAFSAFGWAYAILQIPGGWFLDKFGARNVYGICLLLWAFFTAIQGFIGSFASFALLILFLARLMVGAVESPLFPANSRMTTMWFPTNERGLASSIFNSAQYFSLALFTPVMGLLLQYFRWPVIFWSTGIVVLILAFFWFKVIRSPIGHPKVNQAELDYIQTKGGLTEIGEKKVPVKWAYIRALITNRMLLGIYFGQFCLNTITWFFLTWFPTYLVQAKGFSILQAGIFASIPAIAGFIGGLLGGYISDWFLRRGVSLTAARKIPIIIGLVLSSSIVLANYVTSDWFVIAIMALAFFSKGFGALGWVVVSDTSPKEMVGLSGGIFNFIGNIASIVTPIVIGYILSVTHSFNDALIFVGAMGILGALSYLLIVGNIRRLDLNIKENTLNTKISQ